ncbi:MAG: Nif3-like dinuclear metal center hexameric protein [Bdellovibrionales bacterium]|nr:Nif3-like dinuclear metal center hexameric protein [Bdellovibrionales bacterium]
MTKLNNIVDYLEQALDHAAFSDASLNGLQVEGSSEVVKAACAVDAAVTTARMAAEIGANFLIVHHGIFWGKAEAVTGSRKELLEVLLTNGVSLFASHLPLDAHSEWGNNFSLARMLDLAGLESVLPYEGQLIGCRGTNEKSLSLDDMIERLSALPGASSDMLALRFGPAKPERVAICSGSAADGLARFKEDGFDTFITGEPRQSAYHFARDHKLNAVFAGHYATETVGVTNVAHALKTKFKIDFEFIDCPTGI